MGLSYDEVENLRKVYPDRLQTGSKIADCQQRKVMYAKSYAWASAWAVVFGFFPLSSRMIMSNLKQGAFYTASVSIFAPKLRRTTFLYIGNLLGGSAVAAYCYRKHTSIEEVTAGVWAVQAAHMGTFRPKGPKFVDKYDFFL